MGDKSLSLFIVAGEESGDQLGASLIEVIKQRYPGDITLKGVGGRAMAEAGLSSIFSMEDIAVMGFSAVIARLPTILARINQTAKAAIEAKPDALIIIDSPDFTHRVAKKVKKALPDLPVIDYICPSVWAWRPERAQKMTAYVDHVLAILPFEPQILRELNGPKATYIGHPLISTIKNDAHNKADDTRKTLLVLPGSRKGEITRLLPVFEETLEGLVTLRDDVDVVLPAVQHLEAEIRDITSRWKVPVKIISSEEEKDKAFKDAQAALTASGTVCLELALANIPMISTYKLDPIAKQLRFLVTTWTANLPNLIVDYPAVPEYIDEFVRSATLYRALNRLLDETPQRMAQLQAFEKLRALMALEGEIEPAQRAAEVVLDSVITN